MLVGTATVHAATGLLLALGLVLAQTVLMGLGDVSLACATGLVDALAGRGVREACVSPGSRSTPLALALARDERIRVHVHLDERGAAFFALGLAKASGTPVALACTSGTAAAEYFPAIVEASQARVPLLVLTADRPPRLRGTGANQTIDQTELYGRYARAYLEPPVPDALEDAEAWFDAGVRAHDAATGSPPGPVQINAPFEEPLVPDSQGAAGWTRRAAPDGAGRAHDADAARTALGAFLERYAGRRGVIALGAGDPPASLSLLALGTLLGWPVLAEPLSGLRLDAGQAGRALAAGQLVIGDDAWLAGHPPEVVLQVGAIPTTRATQRLVARADALVVLDRDHLSPDPEGRRRAADRRRAGVVRGAGMGRPRGAVDRGGRPPLDWRPGARRISWRAMPPICCSTPGTNRSRAASRATSHRSCRTARRS